MDTEIVNKTRTKNDQVLIPPPFKIECILFKIKSIPLQGVTVNSPPIAIQKKNFGENGQ
jgi:hypothetical protein